MEVEQDNNNSNNDNKEEKEKVRIAWRRSEVQELSSKGYSQREISQVLQVGLATVNRDITYLSSSQSKISSDTSMKDYQKSMRNV
jgi:Trp operon repressor